MDETTPSAQAQPCVQSCKEADRNNIEAAIKVFFEPGQVVELRAPKAGKHGTVSGYFNDHAKLAQELEGLSGDVAAVYYTLNPVNPALLARANNRIQLRAEHLTNDAPDSIIRRKWLLIDCDPVRPANISSTDDEKKAAKQVASEVRNHLKSVGWPAPVACDSGNAYHLLCRIDLPNDAESRSLLESVLKSLAARFDTSGVKIDQKVFNASRITKAYGTKACKGDSIPERPHRISRMFAPPECMEPVAKELLLALAAEAPKPEQKKSPQPTADGTSFKTRGGWAPELVESTLDKADLNRGEAMGYNGAIKWQHDCLSNPDHKKPDAFTILDADGYVHHHCSHNSCSDLTDADWRKLWEERTGETYPWPGKRQDAGVAGSEVEAVRDEEAEQREEFPAEGIIRNNDSGNALRLIRAHGHDVVFAPEAKGWFVWDNGRWGYDMGNVMMLRKAKDIVDAMFREAMALEEDARNSLLKHAMLTGQQARLNAMIESARSHAKVVKYTDFDADPYLFNTANVTIDLRTGEARKHDRKDLITKMSPITYDPKATCLRWLQFLDEIMLGDQTKVDFLKRARGYGLTGDIREEVFFILWGAGRNGKGVFKDTCHHIMGLDQYVKPASFEMFTVRKGDEKLNDIAGLRGARDVTASESERSKRLAEAKIKQMTGRDPVVGEFKYQEQFSYIPQLKIWLVSNPKPRIVGTDPAIRCRG